MKTYRAVGGMRKLEHKINQNAVCQAFFSAEPPRARESHGMDVIETDIKPSDPTFQANQSHMHGLVDELRSRLERAREGGGQSSVARHRAQGKLPVRDRINRLLDVGSPFLELSPLAAFGLYED